MIRLYIILFIFCPIISFAHHGKKTSLYICNISASAILDASFIGGDGTSEGGKFIGEFLEEYKTGEKIKLKVHGSSREGGYIAALIPEQASDFIYAPIIDAKSYTNLSFAPFKLDAAGANLWTYAIYSSYPYSVIYSYGRNVLRFTIYGNSPTSAMTDVRIGFADCKFLMEE